jgi:hypothetical protein
MSTGNARSVRAILEALHCGRTTFGKIAAQRKEESLRMLAEKPIRAPYLLLKLHKTLCYLLAYPDNRAVFEAAHRMMRTFGHRIKALSPSSLACLENTGIEGTVTRLDFSFDVINRLIGCYPGRFEIDWADYESPEAVDDILWHCIAKAEVQTFDDGIESARDWIRQAKGILPLTDLEWLWRQMEAFIPSRTAREQLFERAAIPLVWSLVGDGASQTANRMKIKKPFMHSRGIKRSVGNVEGEILTPMKKIRTVSAARGRKLISMVVTALATRHREAYPVCRGNPDEVYEVDVGRGARVVVIGIKPEHRLHLEGSYGYMIFKNGIPSGYGGVSPLFHQGNTGVNIFEEYRGGEAAHLYVQVLRVFHTLFGCTCFIVNPFQTGSDNPEALDSGAFWFYYKLMFRPRERDIRELAAREWKKLKTHKARRTPVHVLKRLASSDLHLTLKGWREDYLFDESRLGVCASKSTELVARQACRRRSMAFRRIGSRVARNLGVSGKEGWPKNERRAFENLAPLVGLIHGLENWKASEKRALVRLMRSKGALR